MGTQYKIILKCPVLHVCSPDRKESDPKPTSLLSADSAGEVLGFAWFLFFFVWGIMSDRFLGGNSRENKGKREKILGRQDERLGQVPGCHLAKYVGQPSFAYKSASNLQNSIAGSQQGCQSPDCYFSVSVSLVKFPKQHTT